MFDIDSKERYYMNTFGIKPFANYEQALAHYHSVAPIRGKTVRPLGIRRHHNSASISLDEATGDVILNYHIILSWCGTKRAGSHCTPHATTQGLLCTHYTTICLTLCAFNGTSRA